MLSDFVSLFFPRYCLICAQALTRGEDMLCTHCIYELPQTNLHKEATENYLIPKLYEVSSLKYAFSFLKFYKKGKVQKLLHKLKYENHPEIGDFLGRWYGAKLLEEAPDYQVDLIIPVPLHKSKLRKRGYNQSDGFARGLSDALDTPWSAEYIARIVKGSSQTRKSRFERFKNVDHIFEVVQPEFVKNKHILLVDDVITTGATLGACASPLIEAGCKEISVATIGVAQ